MLSIKVHKHYTLCICTKHTIMTLHMYVYIMHTYIMLYCCSSLSVGCLATCTCKHWKKNLSDSGTVMFCFGQTTKDPLHKVSLPNLFGNQDKAFLWSTSLINIFRLPSVHQQDAHEEHHLQQLHQSQL